jgi:hypothetical protein
MPHYRTPRENQALQNKKGFFFPGGGVEGILASVTQLNYVPWSYFVLLCTLSW